MDDMQSRVVDMEGNVTQLEDKMGESQSRLGDMFKAIMTSQGCIPPSFSESSTQGARATEITTPRPPIFFGKRTYSLSPPDLLATGGPVPQHASAAAREEGLIDVDVVITASKKKK